MADGNKSVDRQELAEKLDQDLEKHLDEVLQKNKDYKYKDGLTSENLEEQIRLIPAFSNEIPTQEDIDASPALQALQALKYETDDPRECARAHKEDGNYHFQKKEYKKAITAYSEGLKQKHDDQTLTAILYTNRAAANFYLGNNRSALNDAVWALKHKDDHMKAYLRASMCCFDLERYDECIEWCDKGLKIDSKEKKLNELKKKSLHQKKQKERDARKKQLKEVKNLTARNNLIAEIESRHINVEYEDKISTSYSSVEYLLQKTNDPHSDKIYMDDEKTIHWPVYFLYPEFNQSDFIEDFNETNSFEDLLNMMFGERVEWDHDNMYRIPHLKVFFEDVKNECLVNVPQETPLKSVLCDQRFVIRGRCPAFIILSELSSYYNKTFEKTKKVSFQ